MLTLFPVILFCLPILEAMVVSPTPESAERKTILFTGWQKPLPDTYFPRTDNYYFRIKPESVIEILMDPIDENEGISGSTVAEHTSITTSVNINSEYKTSCAKEPGCRWECEPRQDDSPPDCACVCFYTDAKWDSIP